MIFRTLFISASILQQSQLTEQVLQQLQRTQSGNTPYKKEEYQPLQSSHSLSTNDNTTIETFERSTQTEQLTDYSDLLKSMKELIQNRKININYVMQTIELLRFILNKMLNQNSIEIVVNNFQSEFYELWKKFNYKKENLGQQQCILTALLCKCISRLDSAKSDKAKSTENAIELSLKALAYNQLRGDIITQMNKQWENRVKIELDNNTQNEDPFMAQTLKTACETLKIDPLTIKEEENMVKISNYLLQLPWIKRLDIDIRYEIFANEPSGEQDGFDENALFKQLSQALKFSDQTLKIDSNHALQFVTNNLNLIKQQLYLNNKTTNENK
jgi:hypothetical protein